VGQGLVDGLLRDLVEGDAADRHFRGLQLLCHVPGDGLALAVRVARQIDGLDVLRRLFELFHQVTFLGLDLIGGLEALGYVDPQGGFGKILDVAHGGLHVKALA